MSTLGTLGRTLLAIALGSGVALGAAAAVPHGLRLPGADDAPGVRTAADSAARTMPLTAADLLCPGADRQGVQGGTAVAQSVRVLAAARPAELDAPLGVGTATPAGEGPRTGQVSLDVLPQATPGPRVTEPGKVFNSTVSTPASVRVRGQEGLAPAMSAIQLHAQGRGEQRVLAASACGPASTEGYLVAGGGHAGRVERLVLTNATSNSVTADVEVLGAKGRVTAEGGRGIVVPARGRTVLLLDALAPGEQTPVVHVRAANGSLHMALSDSWLDGIVPRGGDLATSTHSGTDLVLPGVITAAAPARTAIRVAAPGTEEAVVELRAWTKDGQKGLKNAVTRVPAGGVRDIDVSDLPPGTAAVKVHSDVPVVAGAVTTVQQKADGPGELAWTSATAPVTVAGAPVPTDVKPAADQAGASLLIAADQESTVEVWTRDAAGKVASQKLTVPMRSTRSVAIKGTGMWLGSKTPVHAALVLQAKDADGPLISILPLGQLPVSREVLPVSAG